MPDARTLGPWLALSLAVTAPIIAAATSPFLAYRSAVYITGGFAGILALTLLLIQPVLATGLLPGLPRRTARHLHRACGPALILAIATHVAALWLTSPPDVIDALLFRSPTPFSPWGVLAMCTALATAIIAARRHRLRPHLWRRTHTALAALTVTGSIAHTLLIIGTMEPITKWLLCTLAATATLHALRKTWKP